MRELEHLIMRAPEFGLVAEYVNSTTLKVHSPKFFFDTWLIRYNECEEMLELLHASKGLKFRKCIYHTQSKCKLRDRTNLLRKIKDHNEYVAFHKKKNKINLVDRVLSKGV